MRKQGVVDILSELASEIEPEELIEKILFLKNLQEAEDQSNAGHSVPEETLKSNLARWLK